MHQNTCALHTLEPIIILFVIWLVKEGYWYSMNPLNLLKKNTCIEYILKGGRQFKIIMNDIQTRAQNQKKAK